MDEAVWAARLVLDVGDDPDAFERILQWLDERGVRALWIQLFAPDGPLTTAVVTLSQDNLTEAALIALHPACRTVSRVN